jgi:hypothetical protein
MFNTQVNENTTHNCSTVEVIQDALKSAAIKKKYCKWVKNYRNKKIE